MKIEILCPIHGTKETIEIPDSYLGEQWQEKDKETIFEGDIPCNPAKDAIRATNNQWGVLHVKIHFRKGKAPWVEKIIPKPRVSVIPGSR